MDPTPEPIPVNVNAPGPDCTNPCRDCAGNPINAPGCNSPVLGSSYSAHPVRFSDGEVYMVVEDLRFTSFGIDWGHTRSYSNLVNDPATGANGNSWFVKEWPHLVPIDPDFDDPNTPATFCLVWVLQESLWFDYDADNDRFVARFFVRPKLRHDAEAKEFTLADSDGKVTRFYDFDASHAAIRRGQFKSFSDAAGRKTEAGYGANDLISSFVQEADDETSGYHYTYLTTGVNVGRLSEVRYEVNGIPVKRATYTYYGTGAAHGSAGDLESATIWQYIDSAPVSLGTTYYRYYKGATPTEIVHGLRFVVSPLGYQQMIDDGITPEIATDLQVAGYAKHEFRYHADRSVLDETVNSGTSNYSFVITDSDFSDDFNNWKHKTVQNLPDGNREVVFTNFSAQVILSVFIRMEGNTETDDRWYAYKQYDEAGRTLLEADSSAVESYNEDDPGLVTLKSDEGLIRTFHFYDSSPGTGGAPNRLQYEKVKKGSGGTPIKVKELQYFARTIDDDTVYKVSKEIVFRSDEDGGSEPITTEYQYPSWTHFQVTEEKTILPAVAEEQNGSGDSNEVWEAFDDYGRLTWRRNEQQYIDGFSYDPATDALIQRVQDVAGGAPWDVLDGDHLELVTDYEVDDQGRQIQELGPPHDLYFGSSPIRVRRALWTVYHDATFQRWEAAGYLTLDEEDSSEEENFTLVNPVHIQRFDSVWRLIDDIQAKRSQTTGPLLSSDTFAQASWVGWTYNDYAGFADVASRRVYFDIPDTDGDPGVRDLNYNEDTYRYDILHRRVRDRSPGGTITRNVFHPRGWLLEKWVGTEDRGATDSDPSGGGAPLNNMVQVKSYEYDSGNAGNDGNLTLLTQHVDDETTRSTAYGYDFRNRRISTDGEFDFYEAYTLDNLGRTIRTDQLDTTSTGTLVRRKERRYDDLGRVYQTVRYGVDPATGAGGEEEDPALRASTWYDPAGNVMKQTIAGNRSYTKTWYDAVNRPIKQFFAVGVDGGDYEEAGSVDEDTVLEQSETEYDDANNAVFVATRARFHNASGTGELLEPTGSQPHARVSYVGFWPDPVGRIRFSANYGTNGGEAPSWPTEPPDSSDDVLVNQTVYNQRGEPWQTTDAAGRITQITNDDVGRKTKEVVNVVVSGTGNDENKTTLYTYSPDGALATLTAINGVTLDQVTTWEYGTTLTDSAIASTLLLRRKTYPDVSTDKLEYSYNRQSQQTALLDPRGTVHQYDYDALGRLLHDRVTTTGTGVDASVRRLTYAYEVRGLVTLVTSSTNPITTGTVVNEVENTYNNFEQLTVQKQSHHLEVTSTTPKVEYAYVGGDNNTVRLHKITYPNGRQMFRSYGSEESVNDLLSRPTTLLDDDEGTELCAYQYLGASTFTIVHYTEPGINLTYYDEEDDAYTGLDRFGRVIDQLWVKGGSPIEELQYGYDLSSNRIYRKNIVAATDHDEIYGYDGLNQLINLQRGTLNEDHDGLTGTPTWEEAFTYDPTGNWLNYLTKVNGSTTLDQDRTHNKVNAIATIDSSSTLVGYDGAGNMTKTPKPDDWANKYDQTWDAWDRLMTVKDGSTTIATYAYDGLTRRVTNTDAGNNVRHYYYSDNWQVLEERTGTSTDAERQFVWGQQRVDDLVLRDRVVLSSAERLYSLSDSLSVVAITDVEGEVQEGYEYTTFGEPTFSSGGTSSFSWETLFAGYRFDEESKFYQVRYRYLQCELGRWLSRDPMGESEGLNLFEYTKNNPATLIDILGLACGKFTINPKIVTIPDHLKGMYEPKYEDKGEVPGVEVTFDPTGCNCPKGKIQLSVAVKSNGANGRGATFDGATEDEITANITTPGGTRIPKMRTNAAATVQDDPFKYEDGPYDRFAVGAKVVFSYEVCALCCPERAQIELGCTTYEFENSSRKIKAKPGPGNDPTSLWKDANKFWKSQAPK